MIKEKPIQLQVSYYEKGGFLHDRIKKVLLHIEESKLKHDGLIFSIPHGTVYYTNDF